MAAGRGGPGLTAGRDDFCGLLQPEPFCDSPMAANISTFPVTSASRHGTAEAADHLRASISGIAQALQDTQPRLPVPALSASTERDPQPPVRVRGARVQRQRGISPGPPGGTAARSGEAGAALSARSALPAAGRDAPPPPPRARPRRRGAPLSRVRPSRAVAALRAAPRAAPPPARRGSGCAHTCPRPLPHSPAALYVLPPSQGVGGIGPGGAARRSHVSADAAAPPRGR